MGGDGPEELPLGVPEMDREHGAQLRILQAIREALAQSELGLAKKLMDELDDYTNTHFLLEETLMIQRAYPGYSAHRLEHDRLIGELRKLGSDSGLRGTEKGVSHAKAIERWLVRHIQTFDRAFADYINGRKDDRGPEPRIPSGDAPGGG